MLAPQMTKHHFWWKIYGPLMIQEPSNELEERFHQCNNCFCVPLWQDQNQQFSPEIEIVYVPTILQVKLQL